MWIVFYLVAVTWDPGWASRIRGFRSSEIESLAQWTAARREGLVVWSLERTEAT